MNSNPKLFVALDDADINELFYRAEILTSVEGDFGFKTNLHTLIGHKPGLVFREGLQKYGKPIFADIKMMADKLTMMKTLEVFIALDVDYVSINLSNKPEIIKDLVVMTKDSKTKLLGLTVPSWWDDNYCWDECGKDIKDQVIYLGLKAAGAGCQGIILPPFFIHYCPDWVKFLNNDVLKKKLIKVVPGIREPDLPGYQDGCHQEPLTIRQALPLGADIPILVCGTLITGNADMANNLQRVLERIDQATAGR